MDYKMKLKARKLTYDQPIVIYKAKNQVTRVCYTDVFHRLATFSWKNKIPDRAAFDKELADNKRLADAIGTLHGVWKKATARRNHKEMQVRKRVFAL